MDVDNNINRIWRLKLHTGIISTPPIPNSPPHWDELVKSTLKRINGRLTALQAEMEIDNLDK